MAKRKVKKGEKVIPECIDIARKSLNLFTEDELHEYVKRVSDRYRTMEKEGFAPDLQKAINEVNEQEKEFFITATTYAANNARKFEKLQDRIKSGTSIYNFLHKVGKKGNDWNIENAQRTSKHMLYNEAFGKMSQEHLELLGKGLHDAEILAHMDGKAISNPLLREIGDILLKFKEYTNTELVRANVLRPEDILEDRFLRNIYNQSRVASGGQSLIMRAKNKFKKINVEEARTYFIEKLIPLLNLEKTFRNTEAIDINGVVDLDKARKIIGKTFDNIVQGTDSLFTNTVTAADLEKIMKKRHMFYHYKDWSSWGQLNEEFGKGTLYAALISEIEGVGNKVGMADVMGTAPEAMYNELKKVQVSTNNLTNTKWRITDNLFKYQLGTNQLAASPTLANIGASARALSSISRLGALAINSLSDITQVASIAQRFGEGFWGSYFYGIKHAFDLMGSEERRIMAKSMAYSLNVHMGYLGNYSEAVGVSDLLSKASNTFYWLNLTNAWDRGNKLSAMTLIGRGLGRDSNKSLKMLDEQKIYQFDKFNINEHEWDALRNKTRNKMFTVDNVDLLSSDEIRELWNKSNKEVPLSDYRSHLYRKIFGLFDTVSENAVLDPRAFTRMVTSGNLQAGTLTGEAMRLFMQFKSYPIETFRRAWVGGWQDLDSAQARLMYAFNMAAGNFMLGSVSTYLMSIARGVTPPDPSLMTNNQRVKHSINLLAPGVGIFGKLIDEKSQRPDLIMQMLFTPSVRVLSDPMVAVWSIASGNTKGAKNAMKDWARVANPIGTIPIAEPFFDSLTGQKPYLQPGQRPLF